MLKTSKVPNKFGHPDLVKSAFGKRVYKDRGLHTSPYILLALYANALRKF